jgi:hypothetical protein
VADPTRRLEVKVSERNIAIFRDPAVILIDLAPLGDVEGDVDRLNPLQPVGRACPTRAMRKRVCRAAADGGDSVWQGTAEPRSLTARSWSDF